MGSPAAITINNHRFIQVHFNDLLPLLLPSLELPNMKDIVKLIENESVNKVGINFTNRYYYLEKSYQTQSRESNTITQLKESIEVTRTQYKSALLSDDYELATKLKNFLASKEELLDELELQKSEHSLRLQFDDLPGYKRIENTNQNNFEFWYTGDYLDFNYEEPLYYNSVKNQSLEPNKGSTWMPLRGFYNLICQNILGCNPSFTPSIHDDLVIDQENNTVFITNLEDYNTWLAIVLSIKNGVNKVKYIFKYMVVNPSPNSLVIKNNKEVILYKDLLPKRTKSLSVKEDEDYWLEYDPP